MDDAKCRKWWIGLPSYDVLSKLDERERYIIIMRYFMIKPKTILSELGISQVQVSRIEKRVLLRMRDHLTPW